MGDPLQIRRARATDRRALGEMWRALIDHHRELDPAYEVPEGVAGALQAEIERALGRPSCGVWIALDDDRPVGFALTETGAGSADAQAEGADAWVHELWVHPGWRRRGVGAALVDRALAFFRERGAARPAVRVESANGEALSFWRARGFRVRAQLLTLDAGGEEG